MKERKKGNHLKKWDEVTGNERTEAEDALTDEDSEVAGTGPSISRNPIKGTEDLLEQNDNNLDGVINNLPEDEISKRASQLYEIEEERKKSVLKNLRKMDSDKEKQSGKNPQDLSERSLS